jgi:hypothetical protein
MPFIGNQPALSYTSFAVQHFTTSATTSYTLDHPVSNELDIRLVINNVVQQPGSSYAYTASGTSLTLSAATSATDTMYAVFLGKAVQTVTPASGSVTNAMLGETITVANGGTGLTSGFKNGITMAEQWRLSSVTVTSTNTFLTTNLEKADTSDAGSIGTGMSESSGVFSFPSTGIYLITGTGAFYQNGSVTHQFVGLEIYVTTDNSSYNRRASSYGAILGTAEEANTTCMYIFDVTDISNDKVKFHVRQQTAGNLNVAGATNRQLTGFTFVRLGDT